MQSVTGFQRDLAGQAQYDLSSGYAKIAEPGRGGTGVAPAIYDSRKAAETAFLITYWKLLEVEVLTNAKPIFLHSASVAIDVAAKFLKSKDMGVRLITPTLDIIPNILKRDGLQIEPIDEVALRGIDPAYRRETWGKNKTALFIVNPNNPTGSFIDEHELSQLGKFCKENGIILVVDNCFRAYGSSSRNNDVEILRKSGCSFISIHDTGKIISADGAKTGFILGSDDLYDGLLESAEDYGNVEKSKLAEIQAVAETIIQKGGGRQKIVDTIQANRAHLKEWLEGTKLELIEPISPVSVAWIKLPDGWDSENFARTLFEKESVAVVPGNPFFWSGGSNEQYIRVSLGRNTDHFDAAAARLQRCAGLYSHNKSRYLAVTTA